MGSPQRALNLRRVLVPVFEGAQDVLGCQWFSSLPTRDPTTAVKFLGELRTHKDELTPEKNGLE